MWSTVVNSLIVLGLRLSTLSFLWHINEFFMYRMEFYTSMLSDCLMQENMVVCFEDQDSGRCLKGHPNEDENYITKMYVNLPISSTSFVLSCLLHYSQLLILLDVYCRFLSEISNTWPRVSVETLLLQSSFLICVLWVPTSWYIMNCLGK